MPADGTGRSYKDEKSAGSTRKRMSNLYRNISKPSAYKDEFAERFGKGLMHRPYSANRGLRCMTAKTRSIRKIAASRKTLSPDTNVRIRKKYLGCRADTKLISFFTSWRTILTIPASKRTDKRSTVK